jgi:hypothetical protein
VRGPSPSVLLRAAPSVQCVSRGVSAREQLSRSTEALRALASQGSDQVRRIPRTPVHRHGPVLDWSHPEREAWWRSGLSQSPVKRPDSSEQSRGFESHPRRESSEGAPMEPPRQPTVTAGLVRTYPLSSLGPDNTRRQDSSPVRRFSSSAIALRVWNDIRSVRRVPPLLSSDVTRAPILAQTGFS